MIVVIGSGPAGVAAAQALVDQGRAVTLVDGGVELEPERRSTIDRLAATEPSAWSEAGLREIRRQTPVELGGVPLKLAYGSDYPYRDVDRLLPFRNVATATHASLARGGFSTVWGAAFLPYLARDLLDWPVDEADLAPHYRAVAGFVPLSAAEDDLAEELPLYGARPVQIPPSAQARALITDLERSKRALRSRGFRFGWSRLAVRAAAGAGDPGCISCGLCISGCPYGLIYDASASLARLMQTGALAYRPGLVVERIEERGAEVTLRAVRRETGERVDLQAERVYVACGVVASTRLLLESLDALDHTLLMRDSQYFLMPWLRFRGVPDPRSEDLHTLCQAFVELWDPAVTDRNVHLQVYGFNDLFVELFERLLGPLARPARPLVDAVLARMLLIQGYLHSDVSPSIAVTLRQEAERRVLVLEERRNPATRPTLRRVAARLLRHSREFRAVPVWPALQVAPAGRGFHSGGTFPMRREPGAFECDVLGRPSGFSRVHVVDATVFPTIPSTTITFSVMANAHRIASAYGET